MVPEIQVAKAVLGGIITKTMEVMVAIVVVIRTVVETRHHRNVMGAKMLVVLVEDTTTTTRIREEVVETTATTTRVDGRRTKGAEDRVRADLEAALFVVVVAAIAVEEEAVVELEDHRPGDMVVAAVGPTILTSGKNRESLSIRLLFFSYLNYQPLFTTDNPTYCLLFRFVLCIIPIKVSI